MEQERYMDQEEGIDLKELLYVVKKRIKLVIFLPIICVVAAAVLCFFVLKPEYQAHVSIIISKDQGSMLTQSDVLMYQNLIKTYTEIAQSDVVAQRAISDGKLNTTVDDLESSLTVTGETGTQILTISENSRQPQVAVENAEAMAQAFLKESKRLLPSGTVDIMDHAKLPKGPVKPNKKLDILLAFVLGLMVALGSALIIEYMNDNIKSEEDVERYLGVPIIGVIPKHL